MSSFKLCKCGSLANWNSYFGGYYCHNCGLILEDDQPEGRRGGHMMDIEKLIEQLNGYFEGKTLTRGAALDAATALSTIQAENENLRAELEQVKRERDAAIEDVLDAAITPCSYCKRNPINGGNCNMDNDTHEMYSCWKWCGLEKED